MLIPPGSTDRTIFIYAKNTLTGAGKTGLVAANLNAQYSRVETDNDVTIAAITETNLTALTDAHSDGGWFEVSSTNAPGLYRFDLPDAVCASGAWEAVVSIIDAGANNFEVEPTRIELKEDNLNAAGIRSAVGLASANIDTQLSGIQSDTDNIQTRLPAALVGGKMDSDVTAISGDATAADNLEAWLDSCHAGTAQAGAASSITLTAGAPSVNIAGNVVCLTGGTGAKQSRLIVGYDTGTKVASIYPNWNTNPDNTSTYIVLTGVGPSDIESVLRDSAPTDGLWSAMTEYNSNNYISSNLTDILGQALSESTPGNIANNLSTFMDNNDSASRAVIDDVAGLFVANRYAVGGTGNDTTHVHLQALTYADDEINDHLLIFWDVSASLLYTRWIEDWVNASKLATVATLPITPVSGDLYWVSGIRRDVTGTGGPSAATIADAVWDEARAGHVGAGSFGEGVKVESLNSQAQSDVEAVVDALIQSYWLTGSLADTKHLMFTTIDTLTSQTSFTLTGGSADDNAYDNCMIVVTDSVTFTQKCVGYISDYQVTAGPVKTVTLREDPGIFTIAVGDRVDIYAPDSLDPVVKTQISDILTDTGTTIPGTITTLQSTANDILVDTGTTIPGLLSGLETDIDAVANAIALLNDITVDQVWDEVVEGIITARQMMRVIAGVLAGKVSGGGTTAPVFRNMSDTKNVVSSTVDASGNRTAQTYDLT